MPPVRHSLEQPCNTPTDADHGQSDDEYRHDEERHAVFVVMLFDMSPSREKGGRSEHKDWQVINVSVKGRLVANTSLFATQVNRRSARNRLPIC
jgi:hypothetical protein